MSKSMNEILKSMQSIVNAASIKATEQVSQRVDALESKMDNNHKEVLARLASIEDHIVQPAQKCGAPKTVNTVQYNGIAEQLEPIGQCTYRGKVVNYFGICSKCGQPIIQPSTVAYCVANKIDVTCYTCQKGGTHKFKAEFMVNDPNATKGATIPNTTVDTTITMNCEICGKPRRYKSALDFIEKSKEAEKHGFPKVMCSCCAKAKVAELKAQQQVPQYVSFDDMLARCERDGEVGGYFKRLIKVMECSPSNEEAIVAAKKEMYNAIKAVARNTQMELKMNVSVDDAKAIYGEMVARAEKMAIIVDNTQEQLTVVDTVEYILSTSNVAPDAIKALTFPKLKDLLFEDDVEFAFNGNEWNRTKRAAVDEVVARWAEDDSQEEEQDVPEQVNAETQEPVTEQDKAPLTDVGSDENIGF